MESVIEAKRSTIVQFIQGLRGELFLTSVYHGKNGLPTLKELAGAYLTITKDLNGVKAIYRSWGIPCAGQSVYHPRQRQEWLRKIPYIEDPDSA
jgi:hypothetical protein